MNKLSIEDLLFIETTAIKAGKVLMDNYDCNYSFTKSDGSPVTIADFLSNQVIESELSRHYPDIPIVSEESKILPKFSYDLFWCVDPLDGTKEFIKKDGNFTVNIALINHGKPILGVVYEPKLDILYSAQSGLGAFKLNHRFRNRISVFKKQRNLIAAVSKSHLDNKTESLIKYHQFEILKLGSSLKICCVASGQVDLYPRFHPSSIWDIAAAYVILKEAGGNIFDMKGHELNFFTSKLINPSFVAVRDKAILNYFK